MNIRYGEFLFPHLPSRDLTGAMRQGGGTARVGTFNAGRSSPKGVLRNLLFEGRAAARDKDETPLRGSVAAPGPAMMSGLEQGSSERPPP